MSITKILNQCSKNKDYLGALSIYKPDLDIKNINMIIGILSNNMPVDLVIPHKPFNVLLVEVLQHPNINNITCECLIKLICRLDDNYLLDTMIDYITNKNIVLKLRGYSPMIEYYIIKKHNYQRGISIYLDFIKKNEIELTEKEICYFLTINNDEYLTVILGIFLDVSKYIYQFTNELNTIISNCDIFGNYRIDKHLYLENGKTLENEEYQLNEIKLVDIDRNQILKQIIEFHKHSKDFQSFIRKIKKKKIDIHIDGANIGYFNKRVDKGDKLSYKQIDLVVEKCLSLGKKPLIYLHVRHYNKTNECINKWNKMNILYITPKGIDDDWFWLYGCLSKNNSYVITNDLMRDHHFTLLSKRCFLQWKERHCISFDFKYPKQNSCKRFQNPNNIIIKYPLSYSYRIQYDYNKRIWYLPANDNHWISIKL